VATRPALCHEIDRPLGRELIASPDEVPSWNAETLGVTRAVSELSRWRPDVLYCHGLTNPRFETRPLVVAPAVFLAHNSMAPTSAARRAGSHRWYAHAAADSAARAFSTSIRTAAAA